MHAWTERLQRWLPFLTKVEYVPFLLKVGDTFVISPQAGDEIEVVRQAGLPYVVYKYMPASRRHVKWRWQ